jgi:hypothetical protein
MNVSLVETLRNKFLIYFDGRYRLRPFTNAYSCIIERKERHRLRQIGFIWLLNKHVFSGFLSTVSFKK